MQSAKTQSGGRCETGLRGRPRAGWLLLLLPSALSSFFPFFLLPPLLSSLSTFIPFVLFLVDKIRGAIEGGSAGSEAGLLVGGIQEAATAGDAKSEAVLLVGNPEAYA